jgi:glycosyltransferase involved in cell wall biosynthesis
MVELFSKNVISVVTVVMNDVNNIESTIQSVLSQVGCDIEYIVVDGGSSDGTQDVIEKYRDRIQHYCSEKDQGIYFAMNKGIDLAEGQWMIFLNSGDTFFSTTVLRDVFSGYLLCPRLSSALWWCEGIAFYGQAKSG